MAYPKIQRLLIENFMSIGNADMPIGAITNICGYNDQGKSAIRTALSVLMYDSDSTEQINYIKVGTDYFKVTAIFEDGVSVSKEKRINGASIWSMQKGTEVVYTNLVGDKVIAVDSVPEPIANYWGVYVDEATGQYLNVRIDSDPYFLVSTSGGDNYKILNPLLHGDVLSKASAAIIADSNACKSKADDQAVRYKMYLEQLEQNVAPTAEMIAKLQNAEKIGTQYAKRQECITAIRDTDNVVRDTDIPPALNLVSLDCLDAVTAIMSAEQQAADKVWDNLNPIDTKRLAMLEEIMSLESQDADVSPAVTVVNCSALDAMINIQNVYNAVLAEENALRVVEVELENVQSDLRECTSVLAENGYKICKNCGSLVE